MIGKEIAGRYRIESEIGSGGMGTVFRGIDLNNQQAVAIKHLKSAVAQPEMIERFKREGEALRELNHPNIVRMELFMLVTVHVVWRMVLSCYVLLI